MLERTHARAVTCVVIAALLGACGYAGDDEIQAETAAIQQRIPTGTPVAELLATMRQLGFACAPERREFTNEQHFACTREESRWLVCTRRTRVILFQRDGRLSDVLVNVGHFCS